MKGQLLPIFAHAFGQRYELPIPLFLFVFGGAGIVLLSFLLVLPRKIGENSLLKATGGNSDETHLPAANMIYLAISFVLFAALVACGLLGSQEISENIVPTVFWLLIWIAVPLSCGVIGDWTGRLNPFALVAAWVDRPRLRQLILGRTQAFSWPDWLGWWPAVFLYFTIACGELVYNQTATRPAVTAGALLFYFFISAFMGLLYGGAWLKKGEVFSILFNTWGRLGYFRFGSSGKRGFFGGLLAPFEASPSRIAFTLLLLVSVSFDGLLSTPLWSNFEHHVPPAFAAGTAALKLLETALFLALAAVIWLVFSGFALAVQRAGAHATSPTRALAGLLPSLLPISFGYLLAHNIEYLVVNSQLLFPLIGNPIGKESWPLHLAYPFNDSFEPHLHLLPSSFYWYFSITVIILVHVAAVVLAHRYLGSATKNIKRARRSEYPWVTAMVLYTMLSLWLLAQPLVREKTADTTGYQPSAAAVVAINNPGGGQ